MNPANLAEPLDAHGEPARLAVVPSPEIEAADLSKTAPEWGPVKRILFRFACAYLVLYSFPFPLYYLPIPFLGKPVERSFELWNTLVPWVGKQLFRVDVIVQPNGSGDTTYNYVQVFCFLVLAATATLVWSLLDRKRRSYARLYEWLRVYVRFVLAVAMIGYGASKVIPSQFPSPSIDRLLQPFGNASPMGLLWTFMGASVAYNVFTGLGELVGGLLLTARRTTLLGALVCIGVLSNVVMLNFSYDVPVKLYSLHLLLMAVFLAAHDLRPLANMLVLNRTAEAAEIRPLFQRKWLRVSSLVLRTVFILFVTGMALYQSYQGWKSYGDAMAQSPLYGLWNVEELAVDGQVRPPLVTDGTRWRRLVFAQGSVGHGRLGIHLMDDSRERYDVQIDPTKRTIALTKRDDPHWQSTFAYRQPEPGLLALEGACDGREVRARLRQGKVPEFLLVTRGFHWINERPFNR
jgi:hypothetical protein